jgi:hypothetical protein
MMVMMYDSDNDGGSEDDDNNEYDGETKSNVDDMMRIYLFT